MVYPVQLHLAALQICGAFLVYGITLSLTRIKERRYHNVILC